MIHLLSGIIAVVVVSIVIDRRPIVTACRFRNGSAEKSVAIWCIMLTVEGVLSLAYGATKIRAHVRIGDTHQSRTKTAVIAREEIYGVREKASDLKF
jgi:hypothetical protein